MKEELEDLDRISPDIEAQMPPSSRRLLQALRRIREWLNRPARR